MKITGTVNGDGTLYYPALHEFQASARGLLAFRLHAEAGLHAYAELYDSLGVRRASLVRYREGATPWCAVAADARRASPNCLAGPLPQGVWHCKVALRPIMPAAEKAYAIEALEDPDMSALDAAAEPGGYRFADGRGEVRWRAGDLHSHTTMSDGDMTPREKMAFADAEGLDFYAVTDHDIFPYSWPRSRALALPGVEITTPNGHFNVICPGEPPRFLPDGPGGGMNSCEAMSRLLADARHSGAFCVMNHPTFEPWHCRWGDFDMDAVDALEILCDPTHPGADAAARRALAVWDAMLLDGRRIWGVGGSDSHKKPGERYEGADRPADTGDPRNHVWADGTRKGLTEALKLGRVNVSRTGRLDFSVETDGVALMPGDTVCETAQILVKTQIDTPGLLRVVVNGAVAAQRKVHGEPLRVPLGMPRRYGYVRCEVLDAAGRLTAFSNPIFFGKKPPKLNTWGDYAVW